jgi:predicted RNase H-like HicB family nuclease
MMTGDLQKAIEQIEKLPVDDQRLLIELVRQRLAQSQPAGPVGGIAEARPVYQAAQETAGREFYVVIERDEDGFYVGEVPQLRACYSQGRTFDELMANIKEAIALCLEEEQPAFVPEFIGVQKVRA